MYNSSSVCAYTVTMCYVKYHSYWNLSSFRKKEKDLKRFPVLEYDSESCSPFKILCAVWKILKAMGGGADFIGEEAKMLSKANVNKFKI